MTAPTLVDVAEQLRSLIAGSTSRQQVSQWALQWVTADDHGVDDDAVWTALVRLGAVDLNGYDRPILYHDVDFRAWLEEVEDAIEARHERADDHRQVSNASATGDMPGR